MGSCASGYEADLTVPDEGRGGGMGAVRRGEGSRSGYRCSDLAAVGTMMMRVERERDSLCTETLLNNTVEGIVNYTHMPFFPGHLHTDPSVLYTS